MKRSRTLSPGSSKPWKAPRAPNDKPDLSGVWQPEYTLPGENERVFGDVFKDFVVPGDDPRTFSKYFLNILADFKPGEEAMRPEAAALFRKRGNRESPSARCMPHGIPQGDLDSYLPLKIVQTPAVIVVLYEDQNPYRQIYMDGRTLPKDPQPAWLGYSVGKWEGDRLVVDSAGFNDKGLAGCRWASPELRTAPWRALSPARFRPYGPGVDYRRPESVYAVVHK